MKLLISLLLLILSACNAKTTTTFDSADLVLTNAHILTMENDELFHNMAIIIEDGIILWTGPANEVSIPEGATVISDEIFVMPGLAEMHAHIPQPGQGEEAMLNTLVLYLSQGITTIRGMLGHPAHLELKSKAEAGEIHSPRIFTSGPSFNGNSVQNPEQARKMVRDQMEAGYDLLKLHPGLTLAEFDAISDEANQLGIEFSGHISHDVGLIRSLETGQGTIDHLDRYMEFLAGDPADREDPPIIFFGYDLADAVDESLIEEAARRTAEAGVWNVPTNTLLENIFNPELSADDMRNWPGMEYMPEQTLNNWSNFITNFRQRDDYDPEKARTFLDIRNKLTLALHESGAGLLLGADAPQIFNPPGFAIHRELGLLVDAGLTPFEALKTGTVNIAEYLGETDVSGFVKPGYRADLLLLSSNPLEQFPFGGSIEGVISSGKYYSRHHIDELLDKIKN